MKQCCFLFLVSVLFAATARAGTASIKKLLLTSWDDDAVEAQKERHAFLERGAYAGIPFIDDIEFRLRDDAFDINNLRYSIRVQPRGIGETRAAGRYAAAIARSAEHKTQLRLNQALKERYILALDFMEQQKLASSYRDLSILYEDRIKVLEQKKFEPDFSLNDLIDAENAKTKTHVQALDLQRTSFTTKNTLATLLAENDFRGFDTGGFVDIDSVIERIGRSRYSLDTNTIHLRYFRSQIQLADARYTLEKSESRDYISYIGFSYDNGRMLEEMMRRNEGKTYNLNEAYMIELGIKIPDITTARHDILRRKIDLLSEKEDYERLKREFDVRMKKDREDLRTLIEQYRFLKARESEVDAAASLKKYLQMSGIDPLVLLSIKESIIKNQLETGKLKYGILRNYIRVLDLAGELTKQPLRNCLSKNEEPLQP